MSVPSSPAESWKAEPKLESESGLGLVSKKKAISLTVPVSEVVCQQEREKRTDGALERNGAGLRARAEHASIGGEDPPAAGRSDAVGRVRQEGRGGLDPYFGGHGALS